MAITHEQIIETATALLARGESPTLAAVRRELGGGSFTTISDALKTWRTETAAQTQTETVQVPPKVQEALSQAGVLIWTEATRQHAAQLAAEREVLDTDRKRLEAEHYEAVELADQVARDLDQMREERAQVFQDFAQERQAHEQTRADAREQRTLAEERGRRAEAQEAELQDLRRQIAEGAAEAGQLRGQIEGLQGQIEALRVEGLRVTAERDEARVAFQRAQEDGRAQQGRLQEQEVTLAGLREQLAAAGIENATLSGTVERLRQDAAGAEARASAAEGKVRTLGEARDADRQALVEAEQTAAALRLEVATLTERVRVIEDLRAIIASLQGTVPAASAGTGGAPAEGPAAAPKRGARRAPRG